MSRPMWRVYEVRSKSWSSAPNTISTCSTELRSPDEPVVDPATGRAGRRAGRAPSGASRPRRSRPGDAGRRPCPVGEVLDRARPRASRRPRDGPRASREERLRLAPVRGARPSACELLDERRRGPLAEIDDRPGQERAAAARRPASGGRSGASRRTPAGTWSDDALVPAGPGELGELVVERQGRLVGEEPPGEASSRATSPASVSRTTPAARASSPRAIASTRSSRDRRERRDVPSGSGRRRRRPRRRGGRRVPRPDAAEVGRPQVDVGRVELVRLDRQVAVAGERRPPVGRQPVRLRRRPRASTNASSSVNVSSIGARRGARAAGRRVGRRPAWAVASITRATPPSRASRGG